MPKWRIRGGGVFPRLHSGPLHAAWNLRASWLLKAIIDHANAAVSQFKQVNGPGNPLRALEAALFMIGYDLPAEADEVMGQAAVPPPAEPPCAQATPDDPDEWKKCYTLKHGREFRYRITGSSIEVDDGPTFPDTRVNAALTVLWNHFGENPFPLANSGTAVRRGLAPMGFGRPISTPPGRIRLIPARSPPYLRSWMSSSPFTETRKGSHWTLNANLLRLNSPGTPLNVRPLLDDEMRTQEEI